MTADLHYLSLDEVARRLKARTLSSVEATRAQLDRIAAVDPRLKTYATVTADRALADAATRDAETAAGKSRGPLHGVPVGVKDLCNTAGIATSNGLRPGLAMLAKQLAFDEAPRGIRVNCLLPGRFDTERVRTLAGLETPARVARS